MSYIDQWLTGLGLEYVISKLKDNGITTPKKLATLSLRDMYEVVGVENAEDRKKLYYLIQRLQTILKKEQNKDKTDENSVATTGASNGKVIAEPDVKDKEKAIPIDMKKEEVLVASSIPQSYDNEEENSSSPASEAKGKDTDDIVDSSVPPPVPMKISPLRRRGRESVSGRLESKLMDSKDSLASDKSEDDLRALRRKGRQSTSSAAFGSRLRRNDDNSKSTDSFDSMERRQVPTLKADRRDSVPVNVRSSRESAVGVPEKKIAPQRRPSGLRAHSPISPTSASGGGAAADATKEERRVSAPMVKAREMPKVASNPTYLEEAKDFDSNGGIVDKESVASSSSGASVDPLQRLRDRQQLLKQFTQPDDINVEDMAIRVVVRKRPISRKEVNRGDYDVMEVDSEGRVYLHQPMTKVDLTKVIETSCFRFDDAFSHEDTNEVIYERTIKPLVASVFEGAKASCFAYGQTGSGKTFTMMGANPGDPLRDVSTNAGLYVLAARDLFALLSLPQYKTRNLVVKVSCFEIYSGKLFDLLNNRDVVRCLEDGKQQVQIVGLSEHNVTSVAGLLSLMATAHSARSTGSTGANLESSRSHQILQIVVAPPEPEVKMRFGKPVGKSAPTGPRGKLSFIDLAGSERGADTTNNSKQTRLEGAEINTSLLALKEVIRSREKKQGHTPFRGSKLTQVLKDSFVGENTRTCMIACLSPSHSNCEHTLNTLRYADRVKEHDGVTDPKAPKDQAGVGAAPAPVSSAPKAPLAPPIWGAQPVPSAAANGVPKRPSTSGGNSSSETSCRPRSGSNSSNGSNGPKRPESAPSSSSPPPISAKREEKSVPVVEIRGGKNERQGQQDDNANIPLESIEERDELSSSLGSTGLIQRTYDLLSSHKLAIADMVEVMKDEMELVQNMEQADQRDAEAYVSRLDTLLDIKGSAVRQLRDELHAFQRYRRDGGV